MFIYPFFAYISQYSCMIDWKHQWRITFFFFAHLIVGAGAGSGQQKKTGSGKKKTGSGTYHLVIYIEIQYREDRRLLKKTKKFYIFRYRSHRVGLVALLFAKRIITREGKIRLRPMKAEPPPPHSASQTMFH